MKLKQKTEAKGENEPKADGKRPQQAGKDVQRQKKTKTARQKATSLTAI